MVAVNLCSDMRTRPSVTYGRRLADAERHLSAAARMHQRLGRYLSKYGVSATMSLPITDEVAAHVGPGLRGVLLGLDPEDAIVYGFSGKGPPAG